MLLNILIIYSSYKLNLNQNNYFRLHIVANSNSIDDQIVKLNVSKKITSYLESLTKKNNIKTKANSKKVIINNIDQIIEIANNEVKQNNKDYSSCVNIGKIYYEEKHSDILNMDKGIYDSIQIVLGEGKGENFWSLIFPYSYSVEYIKDNNMINNLYNNKIEIKSGIIKDIKKVVKLLS